MSILTEIRFFELSNGVSRQPTYEYNCQVLFFEVHGEKYLCHQSLVNFF